MFPSPHKTLATPWSSPTLRNISRLSSKSARARGRSWSGGRGNMKAKLKLYKCMRISSAVLVQMNGWRRSFQPSMNPRIASVRLPHAPECPPPDGLAGDDREERHCCIGRPRLRHGDWRDEIRPTPLPPPGPEVSLRRVPLPSRSHHAGGPLVLTVRPVLPG